MMQTLYYTASISSDANLALLNETEGSQVGSWVGITNLIVCGSKQQIIAFSGSTEVAAFSTDGTNIVYNWPPPPLDFLEDIPPAPVQYYLRFISEYSGIDPTAEPNTLWSISSSLYQVSGSTANTLNLTITASSDCIVKIGNQTIGYNYDSMLYLYDTTTGSIYPGLPGNLIASASTIDDTSTLIINPEPYHSYTVYACLVGRQALT